jgi:anaerobic nitric oxide reductase transcription regulator
LTIGPGHLDIETDRPVTAAGVEPGELAAEGLEPVSLKSAVDRFRKEYILEVVRRNNGNWAAAARMLGMHRSNLHKLATRLGIKSVAQTGKGVALRE